MDGFKSLKHLALGDFKRSLRDPRLLLLLLAPWINAIMARLLLPRLSFWLRHDLDLTAYYPLILGFLFLWLAPLSIGLWAAELLLEERSSGLTAVLSLPLPKRAYLAYRLWVPGLWAFFSVLACLAIALPRPMPTAPLIWLGLAASLQTPLLTLLLFAFSADRDGAMALARLLKFLGMLPIFAYFLPHGFGDLIGLLFPPYWLAKAFWSVWGGQMAYWRHLLVGVLLLVPLLGWAKGRFLKRLWASLGRG